MILYPGKADNEYHPLLPDQHPPAFRRSRFLRTSESRVCYGAYVAYKEHKYERCDRSTTRMKGNSASGSLMSLKRMGRPLWQRTVATPAITQKGIERLIADAKKSETWTSILGPGIVCHTLVA